MIRFVFCHGFGFNNHFWDNLAPYFIKENCTFIDLGYFRKPSCPIAFHEQKLIGIGHSLGLLKLLALNKNFECLIGLNGFVNFLGHTDPLRRKRQLELKALKQGVIKKPIETLSAFYARCGLPEWIYQGFMSDLDVNVILSELAFLKTSHRVPPIPMLILASNDDSIVPPQIIEDNFSNHAHVKQACIHHAQHGLGFLKPHAVYENIMSFLDQYVVQ